MATTPSAGAASFAKAAYIPLLLEKDASCKSRQSIHRTACLDGHTLTHGFAIDTSVRLVIWGCVEVGWCVIAASIPMLRPLLIRDADDSNDSRGRRRRPTLFSDSESQSGLPLPFMRIAGRSGSGSNLIVGGSGAMDRNGSSVAVTDRSMTLGPSSVTIDSGSQNDSTQKFTSMTTTTTVSTMSTASIDKQKQNGSQHRRYDADDGGDGEKRPSTAPDHEQTTSNTAQDRPETTTPTLHKRVASISRFREEEVDPLSPASTEPSPQPHPQQSLHSTPLSPPPQELQHQPLPQPQPSPQSSPSAAEAAVSRPATPSLRVQFRIVDFDIVGGVSGADESIRPEER